MNEGTHWSIYQTQEDGGTLIGETGLVVMTGADQWNGIKYIKRGFQVIPFGPFQPLT
jgi:hypothetical protein